MGDTFFLFVGGGTDGVSAASGVCSSPNDALRFFPGRTADHPPTFHARMLVEYAQALPSKPHFPHAISCGRTHSHTFPSERFTHSPVLATKREPSLPLN